MNHLTPEQFVDLADGTQPESAMPHLTTCETCRRELADLRAMMSEAEGPGHDEVPEPPPFLDASPSARKLSRR